MERASYCIRAYLSSNQHTNLTPFRCGVDSAQMTLSRSTLNDLKTNYDVKPCITLVYKQQLKALWLSLRELGFHQPYMDLHIYASV